MPSSKVCSIFTVVLAAMLVATAPSPAQNPNNNGGPVPLAPTPEPTSTATASPGGVAPPIDPANLPRCSREVQDKCIQRDVPPKAGRKKR